MMAEKISHDACRRRPMQRVGLPLPALAGGGRDAMVGRDTPGLRGMVWRLPGDPGRGAHAVAYRRQYGISAESAPRIAVGRCGFSDRCACCLLPLGGGPWSRPA